MSNKNLIEALLQERAGYVSRNLFERIEAIDATLSELGYVAKETAALEPEAERAIKPKARKRKR